MAHFSSEHFAISQFRVGQFGPASAADFPAVNADSGPGWWATDSGVLTRKGKYHRKAAGSFRRYFMDFSALENVRWGDEFNPATVSVVCSPSDLSVYSPLGDGNKAWFTLDGGIPNTIYAVTVTVTFLSGIVAGRTGYVVVDDDV